MRLRAFISALYVFILSPQYSSSLGYSRPIKNEEKDNSLTKQLQTISSNQMLLLKSLTYVKEQLAEISNIAEDQMPTDCSGARHRGDWRSFKKIKPPGLSPRKVRCDQFTAGGGWTAVVYRSAEHLYDGNGRYKLDDKPRNSHRRYNGLGHADPLNVPRFRSNSEVLLGPEEPDSLVNFNKTWSEYKNGFGSAEGEYWIGNEILHILTRDKPWEAVVVVKTWNGEEARAFWNSFRISGEKERYQLEISGYDSSKSSLGDGLTYHSGRSFSTIDEDNDDYMAHCAKKYGGGWWFNKCHVSHLTGTHLNPGSAGDHAVHWLPWKSSSETLKSAALMIRPPKPSFL